VTINPNQPRPGQEALSILIVEDNPVNQQLLKSLLHRLGHTGVVVGDGEKALKCIAKFSFDVVLMDVMMPVMDGYDALKALRAKEIQQGGHLPVIMVTGQTEADDQARLMRAGADGYFAKPVDFKLLQIELRKVLSVK